MKFALNDTNGKRTDYRMRPLSELTLADWMTLNGNPMPDDKYAAAIEAVARLTTAPASKLRRLPVGELERLVDVAVKAIDAGTKAQQDAPPTSFAHKGITYVVPQDLEQVSYAQWFDLTEVHLPRVEREVDAYAVSIAVLCLPDGEEYEGAKMDARRTDLLGMDMVTALRIAAFFFGRSERFRNAMHQHLSSLRTSALRSLGLVAKSSAPATAPSA
jgi:hypothetical protein